MDVNKLLEGVDCKCGKHHTCDIDYVYIEKGAITRLNDICKEYNSVLLVADENTFTAAGEKTLSALANKQIKKVVFTGKKVLVPDESAIDTVTANLDGVDVIIGIGSGVIQDLCKYVSHFNNIPYMVVATAPSMDGYASDGAAMITGGMKVTYKAGLPRAIIADTEVLCDAPIEMIKAGYGDIIGKFSALNDWKLSYCINDEYFCEYIYNLTYEQIDRTLKLASGILDRKEESIKTLMEALVIIGILMSFAGSSRPASGSEHHLSHFFEITGIIDNTEYFPHGIDVAYSTLITTKIRENILSKKFPSKIYRSTREELEKDIEAIYKQSAKGCLELQDKVGNYSADRINTYLKKENAIKTILDEVPSYEDIYDMLDLVGLAPKEFYALYGQDKINDAIIYAKDLKDRYTVLWLNYDLFGKEIVI